MPDVVGSDDSSQLAFNDVLQVRDNEAEQVVEAFVLDRPNPSLCERVQVRRVACQRIHPNAILILKNVIELRCDLSIAIADQNGILVAEFIAAHRKLRAC